MIVKTHHAASNGGCSAIDHSLPDVEVNTGSARLVIGTSVAGLSTSVHVIGGEQLEAHILSKKEDLSYSCKNNSRQYSRRWHC
jgi:ABC-type uncharacterized transport system ATPase subunit